MKTESQFIEWLRGYIEGCETSFPEGAVLLPQWKKLKEELENTSPPPPPSNPFPIYPTFPDYTQNCPCGNNGTQPCWSTACPKRIIVTYGTTLSTVTNGAIFNYSDQNEGKKQQING